MRRASAWRRTTLALLLAVAASCAPLVAAASGQANSNSGATTAAKHARAHKKTKKTKHKRRASESLQFIGFGINRLYVRNNTKVDTAAQCASIVAAASATAEGPAQSTYVVAYLRATAVPASTQLRVQESLPGEAGQLLNGSTTVATPWATTVTAGELGVGGPKYPKSAYRVLLVGSAEEPGAEEGPSAAEFNGSYVVTVTAEASGHRIVRVGHVTIDCP